MSTSKRGGCGRGRVEGPKVDRVAVVKVTASSAASLVVAVRPGAMVLLEPRPSVVGGSTWLKNAKYFLSVNSASDLE